MFETVDQTWATRPSLSPCCGEEGHIASQCVNDTLCVRCGTNRDCKRPRGRSGSPPPRRDAPPVRAAATRLAGGSDAPAAVGRAAEVAARSWRDVVSSDGSRGGSSGPVDFSAPFTADSPGLLVSPSAAEPSSRPVSTEAVDVCYLLPSAGTRL
jgi:hypothetical protein